MEAPYNLVILILVNILLLQMLLKSSCITPTKLPKMLQQRHVNQSEVHRHVIIYQHPKLFQLKQNIYRISVNSFRGNYFFFEFNLMYCDLLTQNIQVRKLFKGGNYSRAETIRGKNFKIGLTFGHTVFPRIVSAETIFFLIWPYVL